MEAPEDGNSPHECPAEQDGGDGRYSSDDGDSSRPAHRPSTAPQPDQDATHTWGREGHLTEAQEAHLASLRRKLPHADDAELLRWLRARAFNVERALALQQDSTAWRKSQRPTFNAPAAQVVEQLLKRGLLNWSPRCDLRGRPVVCINVGRHDPANREACLAALLDTLDAALAASATAELTVVFDVREYGLANADLKTAKRMVSALQRGYPENLGLAVFLGAPRVFGMLWRVVRVLIDARTVSKVHFVQHTAELDALVGLFAVPAALGGRNVGVDAHMQRWCADLLAAEAPAAAQ